MVSLNVLARLKGWVKATDISVLAFDKDQMYYKTLMEILKRLG